MATVPQSDQEVLGIAGAGALPGDPESRGLARRLREPACRPLSLRANFTWTLAGNVVGAACGWGILVLLAKLGTAAMVGQFVLGQAVVVPILNFSMLNLRTVQATDTASHYRFSDYALLRIGTTLAALAVIAAIALAGNYDRANAWVILATGPFSALTALPDVIHGLLQKEERMDQIAISTACRGILSVAGFAAVLSVGGGVLAALVLVTLLRTVLLFGYDIPCGKRILRSRAGSFSLGSGIAAPCRGRPGRWKRLMRLAWLSLPLGIAILLISLNGNIPRYFIQYYLDTRLLGIYGALANLAAVGLLVVGALGQSATPRLARNFAAGRRKDFFRLTGVLMGLGLLLAASGVMVAWAAGPLVLRLLYTPEYAEFSSSFVWIMVAGGGLYLASLINFVLTAARIFRAQLPLLLSATFVSTFFAWLWIPRFGLTGAAMGLLVAVVIQVTGSLWMLVRITRRLPAGLSCAEPPSASRIAYEGDTFTQ